MVNILILIRFNGSKYHGWQIQKNILTIQNIIENIIENIINLKVKIIGCGRTDSKVNAKIYACNFKCDYFNIPIEKFNYILNKYMPNDIRVLHAEYINEKFNSQFFSEKKEYTYIINNNKNNDPFLFDKCYFFPQIIDINIMKKASKYLVGKHDFKYFCHPKCEKKNKVRIIYYIDILLTNDNFILIKICSNGFLHNMVRIISYELLQLGINKISLTSIENKLLLNFNNVKIEKKFNMLPAYALFLTKVWYNKFSITI